MAGGQDFRKRTREESELVQEFKKLCLDETSSSLGGRLESASSSSCRPGRNGHGHGPGQKPVISSHYSSFLPPKLLMETMHVDGTGAGTHDAHNNRYQNALHDANARDGDPTSRGESCNTWLIRYEDMEGGNPSLASPNTGHNSFMRMDISEGERDFLAASPSGSRDELTSPSRTGSDWPQAFGSLARAPLFQDEDGDVAHGFFEEVISAKQQPGGERSSKDSEGCGGKNAVETDEEMSFALVPWAPVNSTSHLRQRIDLLALPLRALKALAAKVNIDPYKRRYLLEKSDLVDLVMQERDASASNFPNM